MFNYVCMSCGCAKPKECNKMICSCGGDYRPDAIPGITGTRDNFGVGKEFKDVNTGKVIDNWKSWEKAGYRNPLESSTLSGSMKSEIRRKIEKITRHDNHRRIVTGG